MTRILLVSLLLLPLAFTVGCGDPPTGDDDASIGNDDDDSTPTPAFEVTLRSVAPYGWSGDHSVAPVSDTSPDPDCMSVSECDVNVDDSDTQRVRLSGENFTCVRQDVPLREDQNGETISLDWTGEGICGLAPEGEYSGVDVDTAVGDLDDDGTDEVIVYIDSWESIVTGDTFFFENEDYLLSGTIVDDLSSVTFHLEVGTSTDDRTINLED